MVQFLIVQFQNQLPLDISVLLSFNFQGNQNVKIVKCK